MTNDLPKLNDPSGAFVAQGCSCWPMTRSWQERPDRTLQKVRLLAELPGILLWAMKGWQQLRRTRHFRLCQIVRRRRSGVAQPEQPGRRVRAGVLPGRPGRRVPQGRPVPALQAVVRINRASAAQPRGFVQGSSVRLQRHITERQPRRTPNAGATCTASACAPPARPRRRRG